MAKTTYRTWLNGETVMDAMLNEQIRDNGNEIWKGTTNGDLDYYTSSTTKTRLAIGSTNQVLSVSGGVPIWSYASLPIAKASVTSFSLISGSYVSVNFSTEVIDTNNFIDLAGANTKITIPSGLGGNYMITANVNFGDDSGTKIVKVRKNGTTDLTDYVSIYPANGWALGFNTVEPLVATDYLELRAWQGKGSTITITSATLSVVKM